MSEHTVVVSAGTYHLPFDRLVNWMEPWVDAHPEARVIMQHGPGKPLRGAENHPLLPYTRLLELCASADAVVLQGGAGGVMDMRALKRIPIVVPRIPVDDEVVDDHQLLFTQRAAELHAIWRVVTREELWAALDAMLTGELASHAAEAEQTPGVANLTVALDTLPSRLRPRDRMRRLRSLVGDLVLRRG